MDARARAAVDQGPDVAPALVAGGVEHVRVAGVLHQVHDARVLVDLQHQFPVGAAVDGLVHAALAARSPQRAHGRHVDDLRVGGVDHDAADVHGALQPHVLPALAPVEGAVDAVAVADRALAVVLAGADPDHVRGRGGDGQAADGVAALAVEDRLQGDAAVGGLPHAARAHGHVPVERVAGVDGEVADPARGDGRAQVAPGQAGEVAAVPGAVVLVGGRRRQGTGGKGQQQEAGHGRQQAGGREAHRDILFHWVAGGGFRRGAVSGHSGATADL